jgi:hypothetical protein
VADAVIEALRLLLPLNNLELVKALKKGQRLRARGIIHDIFMGSITLNYVDLDTVEERERESVCVCVLSHDL